MLTSGLRRSFRRFLLTLKGRPKLEHDLSRPLGTRICREILHGDQRDAAGGKDLYGVEARQGKDGGRRGSIRARATYY